MKCCKICYPLCAFVMLAACVVACVGLVWMQVALKEDLDALKEKFRTCKYKQTMYAQSIMKKKHFLNVGISCTGIFIPFLICEV